MKNLMFYYLTKFKLVDAFQPCPALKKINSTQIMVHYISGTTIKAMGL